MKRSQQHFLFLILFTLLSGAIRKWIVSSNLVGNAILGVQLILPLLFFILYFRQTINVFKPQVLFAFLLYALFTAFNPLNLTYFHGIFGIIMHTGAWCLMYAYLNNRIKFRLPEIVPILVIFCFLELSLAFVQYQLPQTHVINKYVREVSSGVAGVGDAVRVTGTFAYLGGFTTFILFHSFLVWVLFKLKYPIWLSTGMLVLGLIGAFMSGSRGSVYSYLLFTIYFLFFDVGITVLKGTLKSILLPVILILLIFSFTESSIIENQIVRSFDNFNNRRVTLAKRGEESKRIFWDFNQLTNFRGNYPIFGVGLGSTYQGATQLFGRSKYVSDYGYYETENARIVLEGGFLMLLLRISIMSYAISLLNIKKLTKMFLIVFAIFIGSSVFNIYQSIFFIAGLILLDNVNTWILHYQINKSSKEI